MTIIAAADGSALGNPGPAGWAWYVDEGCWAAGGWPESTNNRGELTTAFIIIVAFENDFLVGINIFHPYHKRRNTFTIRLNPDIRLERSPDQLDED